MGLVWRAFPGSGSDLLTMLAMADWCNDEGGSLHPSIKTVAKRIRTSQSQARRVLHKLIAEDWLSVIANKFGGAPGATRRYQLNVARLLMTEGADATPSIRATPCSGAQDGSHGHVNRGRMSASQTVIRTVKEPPGDRDWNRMHLPRGSYLPAGWQPSDSDLRWANEERPDLDPRKEADKFCDYWIAKSGKDAIKANWPAAWRNWIRNAYGPVSARPCKAIRESLTEQSARLNRDLDMTEECRRHAAVLP